MAKKIKRHIIGFKIRMAKVWAYIEESQYKRAQHILHNHKYWE